MDSSGEFQAPKKKQPRVGSRYQLEISFPDEEARQDFMSRLDKAKRWLSRSSSSSSRHIGNYGMMISFLDRLDKEMSDECSSSSSHTPHASIAVKPMLKNSGICVLSEVSCT